MPQFTPVDASAMARLKPLRNCLDRQGYRDALATLAEGSSLEIVPEAGESLRRLKTNVTRAAREIGKATRYGETRDGTLLVWLGSKKKRAA